MAISKQTTKLDLVPNTVYLLITTSFKLSKKKEIARAAAGSSGIVAYSLHPFSFSCFLLTAQLQLAP